MVMRVVILCLVFFSIHVVTKKIGGWHVSRELGVDGNGLGGWNVTFDDAVSAGVPLMRVYVHIPKSTPNRDPLIAGLNKLFDSTRKAGGALILRFYYGVGSNEGEADFATIQKDLAIFAPILKSNADVIFVIQSGMLRQAWGEWWGSNLAPDDDRVFTDPNCTIGKKAVVSAWLSTGIPVQIRYPRDTYILGFADNMQVGMHDDCILAQGAGGPDSGTFDKPSCAWADNNCRQTGWWWNEWAKAINWTQTHVKGVTGGESCSDAGSVPDCGPLLKFFKDFRVSYYNSDWPSTIHEIFVAKSDCYNSIKQLLEANSQEVIDNI